MPKTHRYSVTITWTGNTGAGTSSYRDYDRRYEISADPRKLPIAGSSDPAFRGDPQRWNPEELLVASISACHQLWYLHLCAVSGIVVVAYSDAAEGIMEEMPEGSGRFQKVILHPHVIVTPASDLEKARALHAAAHDKCFIASSVNFPVEHLPLIGIA